MEPRLLVLMAIATAAIAGPIAIQESTNCATECSPSTKFKYAPGTTYLYDYKVDTETSMSGASEDSAKLTLTAIAELEVLGPCEMSLTLRDTRLLHSEPDGRLKFSDKEDYLRRGLERSALRFSFQDGTIDQVCPGNNEEVWALNIKRGALSAFQNNMDDLSRDQNVTEVDVSGTCETSYKYSPHYLSYYRSVEKVKDILSCSDRQDYKTFFQMVPYNVPSDLQNIPLLKTDYKCTQEIQTGGVLQSSTCRESHVYTPFSSGQSGGSTVVTQTLTYNTYKNGVYNSKDEPIFNRGNLLFEHASSRQGSQQGRQLTEKILKEICESTDFDVRPQSPRLFSDLVSSFKDINKPDVEDIFQKLKSQRICPTNDKAYKAFVHALPNAATSASINLMTSLIINEEWTGVEAKVWLVSLAFIQNPTSEMLVDVKPLIDNDKTRKDALLPVTSMVNNFCLKSKECDQSYAVQNIMQTLEKFIGRKCDASGRDFYPILLSLRALGNAGHYSRSVPTLNKCLSNYYNPLEIRVAAAEAFRRMPCDAQDDELWSTYQDGDLDSELRVQAYLALMRCPSDQLLSNMVASLDTEQDEQVGAFVYSHLTNLRQTSDPHKQDIARALDNLVISSKFESSPLKASANLEASALINKINTGFVAESNLIWSNAAQLPRSASANLTVELFGQSINLVDFGGRVEGVDYLVNKLFGSYMGAKQNLDAKSLQGSIFGRIFGNELLFMHSRHTESPLEQLPSSLQDLLVSLAKKNDIALTHSAEIMDARMTVPSVAGLPIDLVVNGSAVIDLVLNGKADFRGLKKSSIDIDGEIRPSAAMEITGTMAVDAFVTRAGLRMRNTLHSSTSLKGRIEIERGQSLNIELDTPQDKLEVYDARSRFFIVHNDVEEEQQMITENRKDIEYCSSEKLAHITGATLCGQISYPNASHQTEGPWFPLTGPSSASIVLRKTDTHSGYKLLAKRVSTKRMDVLQLSFNTPGSRVDRVILLDMTMDYREKNFDAKMTTPWKNALVKGEVIDKKDLKRLSGQLTIDNSDVYALNSEVKISKSKSKLQMNPMIEIKKPGMKDIQLSGFISVEKPFKSVDVDLSLTGLQKRPYNMKTTLTNTKKQRSLQASYSDDGGKSQYSVELVNKYVVSGKKSNLINTQNTFKLGTPKRQLVVVEAMADYKEDKSLSVEGTVDIHKVLKNPATVSLNLRKSDNKQGSRYDVDANVKASAVSGGVNTQLTFKDSGKQKTILGRSSIDYTIPKFAKNKIILNGKFMDRSTKAFNKYTIKSSFDVRKNPEYNFKLDLDLDHKKKHSEAELQIKYGPKLKSKVKRLFLNTEIKRGKSTTLEEANVDFKVKAEAPEFDIDISLEGGHKHNKKMVESSASLNYGKGKDVKASLSLKNKSGKYTKGSGRAALEWPGSEYILDTKVDQKSPRHLTHTLSLKGSNGIRHSIDTVYKMPNADSHSVNTEISLDGFKKSVLTGKVDFDKKEPLASAEVQYGKDTYGINARVKKTKGVPKSMNLELKSPQRRVEMQVNGEKSDKKYEGSITASWDADSDPNKKITLEGSVFSNPKRSIVLGGDVAFTSPFDNFENVGGSLKYISNPKKHAFNGKIKLDDKEKQITTELTLDKPIRLDSLSGSFEARTPSKFLNKMVGSFEHKHGAGNIKSSAKVLHNGENYDIELIGSHDLSSTRKINGEVKIDSPWKYFSPAIVTLDHEHGTGLIKNKLSVAQDGKTTARSEINSEFNRKDANVNVLIKTPLHDHNIEGEINAKYSSKPYTANMEVKWHPRKAIKAETSIDASRWDDTAVGVKLETPFRGYRNVNLGVSNKRERNELVSLANLDYGPRKNINLETRYALKGKNKLARVTLTTPFEEMKSLDTGFSFSGKARDFVSSADFQLLPKVGKFQGSAEWHHEKDVSGKLRINTPYAKYPYFELSTSRKDKGKLGELRAEARMHPRQIYSLSSLYSFRLPISLEVAVRSPFQDYDNLGVVLKHNHSPTSVATAAELKYQTDKKLEAVLDGDWSTNIEGSLTVKTPFLGYENNKLDFSHRGDLSDFNSRGKIDFAKKTVLAEASFKSGPTTTGTFSLSSPIKKFENINLRLKKRGKARNFRGEVELRVNDVKNNVNYQHKLTKKGLKYTIKVNTPLVLTEQLKVTLDHNGPINGFTNEISAIFGRKYNLESSVSFDYKQPDVSGHGTINYQLGKRSERKTARISLSKNGWLQDMTFSGTVGHEDDEINVSGAWKNHHGIDGRLQITTPFDGFKRTGLTLSHAGPINDFISKADLVYMDGKNINGKIELNINGVKHIRLDSEFATPFEQIPSASIKLNHDYDGARNSYEGEASLMTPVASFGSGSITYTKAGELKNLEVATSVKKNGRQVADLQLSNVISDKEIHSSLSIESTSTKNVGLKVDHVGDFDTFRTQASVTLGEENVDSEIYKSGSLKDLSVGGNIRRNNKEIEIGGTLNIQNGVDANLDVRTPFDNFNKVGMSLSASGKVSDFRSKMFVEYMDDKKISQNADFTFDNGVRLTYEMSTPFRGFEIVKLEASGAMDNDLDARVSLETTIKNFGKAEASVTKTGKLENLEVFGRILKNNVELGNVRVSNSLNGDNMRLSLTTTGSKVPESNVLLKKDGKLDDIKIEAIATHDGKEVKVDGQMKLKPEISGLLTIQTPVKGYKNVGMSFKHDGDLNSFISEGKLNLVDDQEYSGKIDFYRNQYHLVEINMNVNSPVKDAENVKFDYRHSVQSNSMESSASLDYGLSKNIKYDLSATLQPNIDFSITAKTPFKGYKNLRASANIDRTMPQVSIDASVNAGKDRQINLRGSLDVSSPITGSLSLTTPLKNYNNIGLEFELSIKEKKLNSNARVTYMGDKDISGKIIMNPAHPYVFAEVKSPFKGFETTSVELQHSGTKGEFVTTATFTYGEGQVISSEVSIAVEPKPSFDITIKTPVEDYEELRMSGAVDHSWPRLELNSRANIGLDRSKKISLDALLDASNDISGSIKLRTPLENFNDVGVSFQHIGNMESFDSEGAVTYMDGKDISGKIRLYKLNWRRLEASAELSTPFSGARFTKAEVNYEDNSNSISTTAALEYGEKKKLESTVKLTYSPLYDALITVKTPFKGYKLISVQSSLDTESPSFGAALSLNYGQNTAYSAKGKLNVYSPENVDGELEVVLPFKDFEYTKAEYQHKLDSDRLDGSVSIVYQKTKMISADLSASNAPEYDASLTIRTPFDGFENIKGSASFGNRFDKYDLSSSLVMGSKQTFSVVSELDISDEPYRASVKMNTPHSDYRNMELVLTHKGNHQNFHSTGFFSSPLTDSINAEAKMVFNSLLDMEASAYLQSTFEGMDKIVAEIKNSEVGNEMRPHILLGWTNRKQIIFDGLLRKQDDSRQFKLYGDVSLTTPFKPVRNLAVEMDLKKQEQEITHLLNLELNGDKLLDMDLEVNTKEKKQVSVTVRKPQPMKYTITHSNNDGTHEAEILADWNRDKVDSNARIVSNVVCKSTSSKTDYSVDVKLEHASRKMGVVHKHVSSEHETVSSGKIYWASDKDSQLSYDMQVQESSRRRKQIKEGHFIVGLPSRTLKLSGSSSDNSVTHTTDATFSWDANRLDKQIGIKSTINRGDRLKGDITLSMPALRKEIRVDGELMTKDGKFMLDARTDISYSQDSRKTLTLISKLEDKSDYYSHFNYSLAVGLSHPYTNVDIQMTSQLGCSDDRMTVGVSTDYLTANRQNKNLGLLAEINKLKRQINLQVTNPTNKLEIIGNVVSTRPYKLSMLSKINDAKSFQSDLTLDGYKKTVELNLLEGSDGLNLWAGYPNKTAFRSEVKRVSYGQEDTETLLAVRLNTTRLLHTRVHWNPELLDALRQEVLERATAGGIKVSKILDDIDSAVKEELSSKYSDITAHIQEEMEPLLKELESEMAEIARSLNKLSRQMRNAYKSNSFYVKDMGDTVSDAYQKAQRTLKAIISDYKKASAQIIASLREGLQQMTAFSIGKHYSELISESVDWINDKIKDALESLEMCLAKTDEVLGEYHEKIVQLKQKVKDTVYNVTYVNYISNKLGKLGEYMPSLEIPEEYSDTINEVRGAIGDQIGETLDKYAHRLLSDAYQQSVWVYNYLELEENVYEHAHNILKLLREIVKDELKEYLRDLHIRYLNPITVWDPEHGEVQADFKLPLEVARLDELPDLSPILKKLRAQLLDTSALKETAKKWAKNWDQAAQKNDIRNKRERRVYRQ